MMGFQPLLNNFLHGADSGQLIFLGREAFKHPSRLYVLFPDHPAHFDKTLFRGIQKKLPFIDRIDLFHPLLLPLAFADRADILHTEASLLLQKFPQLVPVVESQPALIFFPAQHTFF